jgi:hypothetical protein
MLYQQDHFAELTGRPQWQLWQWKYADPEEHLSTYREMIEQAPFEILQPQAAPSREERAETEIVERDGEHFIHSRRHDTLTPVRTTSGHATDYTYNETARVRDEREAAEKIIITRAEDMRATGCLDYAEAAVRALGHDHFIMPGGVAGVFWCSHFWVGLTNLLMMAVDQPRFVDTLCAKMLEQNIEHLRLYAAAGGDAIYVDDALATSDMISVAHYERFCLPYMVEMVREIHRLGQKAIVIYYGGVSDRLDQIASIGADGFSMETTMKNYVNDLAEIAPRIGHRVTLFGNVDPVGILERGTDAEVEAEMARQAAAGRRARGFIACTGSPITPRTPLARVRRFIALGRGH